MKRILLLLLAVLMLTACGKTPQDESADTEAPPTTMPTEPEPEPTEPPELWMPEETTDAVMAYAPQWEGCSILPLEDGVLMFVPEEGQTRVMRLEGESLMMTAETVVEGATEPACWKAVTQGGFSCYPGQGNSVYFYDSTLKLTKTVSLPGETVQNACVPSDASVVYYSTGADLMIYDMTTELTRPLRIGGEGVKTIVGLSDEDTLLMYNTAFPERTEFCVVSTADGQMVQTVSKDPVWIADGTRYYVLVAENHLQYAPYGQRKWELTLSETGLIADVMPTNTRVLAVDGTTVNLYDLQTGKRVATLALPEETTQVAATFATDGAKVWIQTQERVYLWDPAMSPANDYRTYTKKVR